MYHPIRHFRVITRHRNRVIAHCFRAGIGLLSGEHLAKGKLSFVFQVDKALDAESRHDRRQKKWDGVHEQREQKRTDQL